MTYRNRNIWIALAFLSALWLVASPVVVRGQGTYCIQQQCAPSGETKCPDESCESAFCEASPGVCKNCTRSSAQCTCPTTKKVVTIFNCSETVCTSGTCNNPNPNAAPGTDEILYDDEVSQISDSLSYLLNLEVDNALPST